MNRYTRIFRIAMVCLVAACVLPVVGVGAAHAQGAEQGATVRSAVQNWLKGRYKVESVRKSPVAGIWEVQLGREVIYVDEKGQHAFIDGNLVDIRSNRNLTRERLEELSAIDFKALPLELAIKQVKGNGKRVLAIFEDPNCGYCKRLRQELEGVSDLTLYTFVLPILSSDSEVKSRKVLCAADKSRAWNELMLEGKVPGNSGSCDTSLAKLRELAERLGVSATPTGFFANGKRLKGYVPAAQLEKMLSENSPS